MTKYENNTWPNNQSHFQMIESMEQVLRDQDKWVCSSKLAEYIGREMDGGSESTAKTRLSEHREYLVEEEPFVRKPLPDGTPGKTTIYWRHEDNSVDGKVTPNNE